MTTSRDRVITALAHGTPDRVPLDLGGCNQTTMHAHVISDLRDHFGLEKRPVTIEEPYTMMGRVDEDLKSVIGVDVDAITTLATFFGPTRDRWKEYTMEDGLEVLVPEDFNVTRDESGTIYAYPMGDTSVPPSGRMPAGGYYFDAIIRQHPIDEEALDSEDNLEEFGPISDAELEWMVRQLDDGAGNARATLGVVPGAGLGDIACVPAPWLKDPRGIRDIAEWYMSTVLRTDYLHEVFDRQTEIAIQNMVRMHEAVGNRIDVAWMCGTDFGTQTSTFCSVDTFTELYKPYYRKMNDWVHTHTTWKTFKHCCGAMEPMMEGFIEAGFDIMNPVQWTASGMDARMLKDRYGDRIVFWGGGVDTQRTLPFGTPEQVREEVLRSCEVFAEGGGFVFNTIHNIQAGTPAENVVAMIDAVREFDRS